MTCARVFARFCALAFATLFSLGAIAQTITLHGAVQFNDDHAFNKALLKFEELVKKYYGKPINFVLHRNSELGLEKDYFAYMNQGISVDYAIVSPAHMSTFSKAAPFIDAPFLFRDLDHWNKVIDADLLKPVADEVAQKADVMLIGYAGGGTRNIFANKPVRNLAEMKGLKVRVQGAPIWSKTFAATGHVADSDRVQRNLQRDPERRYRRRRKRGRRGRDDEVLRGRPEPEHDAARDHDPSDLLFQEDLREAAQGPAGRDSQGGKEAGAHGRQIESSEDNAKARRDGEIRQAEADSVRRSRADAEAGRAGHGDVRQGDRRRRHLREDPRDQVVQPNLLTRSLRRR
jgi:hypothetical protein